MNIQKIIKKFNKSRNKIQNEILIVGSGRWTRVLLSEIKKNFPIVSCIYILTSNKNNIEEWIQKKKIKKIIFVKNISLLSKYKINKVIIANSNKDHFKFTKFFLIKKYDVLVEKPLLINLRQYNSLVKLSKKNQVNLHISMQFIFSKFFGILNKKINKNNIKEINFEWCDKPNEKRDGLIKKHDLEINYIEDIIYHIFSILNNLLNIKEILPMNSILKKGKFEKIKLRDNKRRMINIKCSRNYISRKRMITIILHNEIIKINFSNDRSVTFKSNLKKVKTSSAKLDKTLKYQLFNFLRLKKLSNKVELNDIRNLKLFFNLTNLIK